MLLHGRVCSPFSVVSPRVGHVCFVLIMYVTFVCSPGRFGACEASSDTELLQMLYK